MTFEEWWAENESAQRDRAKLAWKLVDEKVTEAKREMRERAALENCSMCMLPLIWKPETDGWHVLISDLRISAPFRERRRCLSESIRALPLDAPDRKEKP